MKDWISVLIAPEKSIHEAIRIIDESALQIALVVDEKTRLLGTVTDGDVRRAILKQISLNEPVKKIMYSTPTVARTDDDKETILSLMRPKNLRHIPVVDKVGRLVDLKILMDLVKPEPKKNSVVLMAGGAGVRLQPHTNNCPKPLLHIGCKPILETILENFIDHGFSCFYISVNYKGEMIEEYFEDGKKWDVEISYIREGKRLGTAGSLSLLPKPFEEPFIVMNADLITRLNFSQLLDFHYKLKSQATMAVREYDFQIPYGVVKLDDDKLVGIDEKPVQRFFVNAGIYVLDPDVVDVMPKNQFFDMTELFKELVKKGFKVSTFPIREYWLDIGNLRDFEKANGDYDENFE